MLANNLRKGWRVQLENGWMATIADNKRGMIRMALVEGYVTELGSIYANDIRWAWDPAQASISAPPWVRVELSPAQDKQAARIRAAGF